MKRNSKWMLLLTVCAVLCLSGCRQREQETEPPAQVETTAPTEKMTEKPTEKVTEKPTEKESETEKKTTAKQTTVKPSTTGSTTNKKTTTTTTNTTNTTTTATKQCPYCYQQISTAPDGNGSTIYDVHVAQEKNWADLYGYGDQPPANQQTEAATEAPQQNNTADDSKQCGYCYQWFSVSDGSYAAHLQQENQALGLPEGTEYKVCPKCGNAYPVGSLYDNHVCVSG